MVIAAAACGGPAPASPTPDEAAPAPFSGGVLRVVMPLENAMGLFGEGHRGALDPHRDWPALYDTWELMRCCLARTLLSTNGRSTALGGARLRPDVAAEMPEVSSDGLTWTFRLRQGLRYAPPMADVEITAPDFIRSFHRLLAPAYVDEYFPSLFTDIVGAAAYRAGESSTIAGFESPDPHTLVIRLTEPAGDLAARLATPVTVPIPPSPRDPNAAYGAADGHDDDYGRFFVSSGPYMIEGAERLNLSAPIEQHEPVTGLISGSRIELVPNPSWSAASDSLRVARAARIEVLVRPTLGDAIADVQSGTADVLVNPDIDPAVPADVAAEVAANPELGRVHISESGAIFGAMMNLAIPPFDDIHVRRAVSHAINRAAIVDILGGPLRYRVSHHAVPDSMEDNLLLEYRPFASADGTPNLEAARAEMAQSAYDSDRDGLCDAPACTDIFAGVPEDQPLQDMAESVRADLAHIGIQLGDEYGNPYDALFDPTLHMALFIGLGWSRDYLSASNFFVGQFYGAGTGAHGSLLGATPEQLADWGYEVTSVPSVNAQIEACVPLLGAAQFECWAALDQHISENVVVQVPAASGVTPILVSRRVSRYMWDELITAPSYDQIELASGLDPQPTAAPTVAPVVDVDLEGLWETPRLTADALAATLAKTGLDPGAIYMVVEHEGFEEHIVYQVEIEGGRWTIYASPDGQRAGTGWVGTYSVPEPGRAVATDREGVCTFNYDYDVSGDQLTVDLIDPVCSEEDKLFQTLIFESAPFTRLR